jgi:hypothetical protein
MSAVFVGPISPTFLVLKGLSSPWWRRGSRPSMKDVVQILICLF